MHLPTVITALFTAFALAAPEPKLYHGVGLTFIIKNPGHPNYEDPAPIEINVLGHTGGGPGAVKLEFDDGLAFHVDVDTVECRAYKDKWGFKPLAVFTNKKPAILGEDNVEVGSILCYVT